MSNEGIWTTEKVERALEKLRYGEDIDNSCFHERDPELKASNILFQLTDEEEQEFLKCSQDVTYFVEKYCRFVTDYGRQTVYLRPFQKDILDSLGEEIYIENLDDFGPKVRNYILMASRQTGKCFTFNTLVTIYNKSTGNTFDIEIGKFFIILSKLSRKHTLKQKLIDKLKPFLYKIYDKL